MTVIYLSFFTQKSRNEEWLTATDALWQVSGPFMARNLNTYFFTNIPANFRKRLFRTFFSRRTKQDSNAGHAAAEKSLAEAIVLDLSILYFGDNCADCTCFTCRMFVEFCQSRVQSASVLFWQLDCDVTIRSGNLSLITWINSKFRNEQGCGFGGKISDSNFELSKISDSLLQLSKFSDSDSIKGMKFGC